MRSKGQRRRDTKKAQEKTGKGVRGARGEMKREGEKSSAHDGNPKEKRDKQEQRKGRCIEVR